MTCIPCQVPVRRAKFGKLELESVPMPRSRGWRRRGLLRLCRWRCSWRRGRHHPSDDLSWHSRIRCRNCYHHSERSSGLRTKKTKNKPSSDDFSASPKIPASLPRGLEPSRTCLEWFGRGGPNRSDLALVATLEWAPYPLALAFPLRFASNSNIFDFSNLRSSSQSRLSSAKSLRSTSKFSLWWSMNDRTCSR